MDASLEEAARASGANTYQIMRQITLPLVLPAILAGGLLAFIGALANFGIPALLGMRARFFRFDDEYLLRLGDSGFRSCYRPFEHACAGRLYRRCASSLGYRKATANILSFPVRRFILRSLAALDALSALFVTAALVLFLSITPIISMFLTALFHYWGAPLTMANITLENFIYILKL